MQVYTILKYIYFEIPNAQSSNIFFLVLSFQEYQELLFINSGNYHLILNYQAEKCTKRHSAWSFARWGNIYPHCLSEIILRRKEILQKSPEVSAQIAHSTAALGASFAICQRKSLLMLVGVEATEASFSWPMLVNLPKECYRKRQRGDSATKGTVLVCSALFPKLWWICMIPCVFFVSLCLPLENSTLSYYCTYPLKLREVWE